MWRGCESRGSLGFLGMTRLKSKQERFERTACTGGSCTVITRCWNKAASEDGTRQEPKLSRGNRKKNASEKRMCASKSALELPRNSTTHSCKVLWAPRCGSALQ